MLHVRNEANESFIHIWQEAFGDTKEEIQGLLTACEGRARILLWEEGGETAGQCVLVPAMFLGEPVWYLYAVATAVRFRRQGICTKLLCSVKELLAQDGRAAVLVPADAALAKFYEKRGFFPLFFGEKTMVIAEGNTVSREHDEGVISHVDIADIDMEAYLNLREMAFREVPMIELPRSLLTYAIEQQLVCGGKLKKLLWNGREYGILCQRQGDSDILLKELTAANRQEARQAAAQFLFKLGEKKACLQRSYPTYAIGIDCTKLQSGKEQGYFNLVLD